MSSWKIIHCQHKRNRCNRGLNVSETSTPWPCSQHFHVFQNITERGIKIGIFARIFRSERLTQKKLYQHVLSEIQCINLNLNLGMFWNNYPQYCYFLPCYTSYKIRSNKSVRYFRMLFMFNKWTKSIKCQTVCWGTCVLVYIKPNLNSLDKVSAKISKSINMI